MQLVEFGVFWGANWQHTEEVHPSVHPSVRQSASILSFEVTNLELEFSYGHDPSLLVIESQGVALPRAISLVRNVICVFVYVLGTAKSCAKAAEPIEVPSGMSTRVGT